MIAAFPGWRGVGLAALFGAFMALGQAPLGWWWATLPALAGLIWWVVRAPGGRAAVWLAWFGGAGYFAAALNWIVDPFLVDPVAYGWMAPFAVVLISFGLALFWAAAAVLAHLARLPFGARALMLALTLTAAELARGYVLTGFPWALIGHVWVGTPPAQVAALIGPSGLVLMTTLAAALPVALRLWGVVGTGALLSAAFAFGAAQLNVPDPAARGVTLRLVQPNAEQHLKWDPEQADTLFRLQLGFTNALPRPDAVIWPETAVPYLLTPGEGAAAAIALAGDGVPVIVGTQRLAGDAAYNSMAVIGAGGALTAVYDKSHLVPFGEYMPFGDTLYDLFGITAFASRTGNGYTAGPGAAVLDLGGKFGKILPLICYEAVFPQDLRAAPTRADWILQITNDAWFGTLTGPWQHLAQARLRAIEQGLPLVRVANTGITGLIDARGRVLAELPFGEAGYLDVGLPGALAEPFYAQWGEIPVIVLLIGGVAGLMTGRRRVRA